MTDSGLYTSCRIKDAHRQLSASDDFLTLLLLLLLAPPPPLPPLQLPQPTYFPLSLDTCPSISYYFTTHTLTSPSQPSCSTTYLCRYSSPPDQPSVGPQSSACISPSLFPVKCKPRYFGHTHLSKHSLFRSWVPGYQDNMPAIISPDHSTTSYDGLSMILSKCYF